MGNSLNLDDRKHERPTYKITVDYSNGKFDFELLFATWNSMYLTGKITATTKLM